MVKAVVGANWGDEGKGKITDMLGKEADIIVRFQGGANAGHTIVNDYGKFALHTLPSGVFYDHTTSIIGNGVALDIPRLFGEVQQIVKQGVPQPKLLVSDRAQIVMSYHKNFDAYEEERLGGKSFGSTKSGIAPFYSDKYAKIGFQVSELFDDELLKEKVVRVAEQKNVILEHLYHKPLINPHYNITFCFVNQISFFLSESTATQPQKTPVPYSSKTKSGYILPQFPSGSHTLHFVRSKVPETSENYLSQFQPVFSTPPDKLC